MVKAIETIKRTITLGHIILVSLLVVGFAYIIAALAAPPASEYAAGDTLAPNCNPGDTNCSVTAPLSANDTIALSGDWSGSGTTAITTTIVAEAVEESMLKAVDSPSDEECLTYETTTGDFEWQTCGSSYSVSGTLLDLTGSAFSVNEGTLTDAKGCSYAAGVGLVCNSSYLTTVDIFDNTNLIISGTLLDLTNDTLSLNEGNLTNTKYCTYVSGTGLVCNSDAAGLSYILEAASTASPNDTVYVDSLTANGSTTNVDLALIPKGSSGCFLASVPDATATGGNKRGTRSVDLQRSRSAADQVAADYSVILGGANNKMDSGRDYGAIGGGSTNYLKGDYCTIVGGYSNQAGNSSSTDYATVVGGRGNQALATNSAVLGGYSNVVEATAANGFIGGGYGNRIYSGTSYAAIAGGNQLSLGSSSSASYSFIGNGTSMSINAQYSGVLTSYNVKTTMYGQDAHASGGIGAVGDSQASTLVARKSSTDGTEVELFLDGTDDRLVLPSDTTWQYDITIIARRTDVDGEGASYRFMGGIDNNAGTVALVGAQVEETEIEDTAAWDCNVAADDTNDALTMKCTGEAAKTIRWVANITLVEVAG